MFESRLRLLQNSLTSHETGALLITSTYNISYLTGIKAFSVEEREARLLITSKNAYLFTDARYTQMVKDLKFLNLVEITSSTPFINRLSKILEEEQITSLGLEEENITYKEFLDLEEKVKTELIPTVEIVEDLRVMKDNEEAEKIKEACSLTDKAFLYILNHLHPGKSELEIKAQLENYIRLEGGDIAFPSIVAFGRNSAIPHHMSSANYKLQTTDCILLDFGAKVDGYCSDMTRTVFLGKPTEEFDKLYKTTLEAQEVAIDYLMQHMKEGFLTNRIHEHANSHIRTCNFPIIPHAIGHGVGLQVHENPVISPYSEDALKPGMVITIEPGIYLPEVGGVRIEDTILITADGLEMLTKSSKELIII